MPPSEEIFRPARTVMIGRALGLFAAFAAFAVTAKVYGASAETDAYFCAYAVPYAIFVVTASIFPPSFVGLHARVLETEGEESARRFSSACLTAATLGLAALAALGLAAAPLLATFAGRGLPDSQIPEVARQMAWLMPIVILGGVSNLGKGVLNARRVFFSPSLDTLAFYAALLPLVWWGAARWGIWALVAGTLAGAAARVLVLTPDLLRGGWRPVLAHPRVREWAAVIAPLAIGAAFQGLHIVLLRALASMVPRANAISYLGYAERLAMVPVELAAASVGVAMLPSAARRFAGGDREGFARVTTASVSAILLILVPAAAGLALLATPVVTLLYEHGRFLRADTAATADILRFLVMVLPGCIVVVLWPAFFAIGRIRAVVAQWVAQTVVTAVLGIALVGPLGLRGVAIAYAISIAIGGVGCLVYLARIVPEFRLGPIAASFARVSIATALMAGGVYGAARALGEHAPPAAVISIAGTVGLIIYAGALGLGRTPEWKLVRDRLRPPKAA